MNPWQQLFFYVGFAVLLYMLWRDDDDHNQAT